MSSYQIGSICVSDIPKEKLTKGKNGKLYLSIIVWQNDEADKFGNHASIQVGSTKEERDNGYKGAYIGNLKNSDKTETPASEEDTEDLPF